MTTVSYPAVGSGGLTAAQWSILYGGTDGIYNDFTSNGDAFALTLISASNTARVLVPTVPAGATAPVIKVNGYGLQVTANEDFTVPTPGATTVYSLYAQYDPVLNVADGSGNAAAAGPVRLKLDATVDTSKPYVLLYTLRRNAGQALSGVVPNDYRRWVGPCINTNLTYDLEGSGSPYPRGTIQTDPGGSAYVLEPNSAGNMQWLPLNYTLGTSALTYASGMAAQDTTARYTNPSRNGVVRLTGTVKRSSGAPLVTSSATADVHLCSIPSEYAPANIKRFPVYGSGGSDAEVKVTPDGLVWVYAHGTQVTWVDLSAVNYQMGT